MIENASAQPPHPYVLGALPGYDGQGIVRRLWNPPAKAMGSVQGWCCQCVEEDPADAWDEAAAPFILQEAEWMIWRSVPRAEMRRRWVRGRVAAKDAVRHLLLARHDLASPLESIGIVPDERGQPQVACDALKKLKDRLFISISHCGNSSVALAAECSVNCHGIGIDVASRTDNHEGLAEGGFIGAETALVDSCWPEEERNDWLLRLWCAKEAVGKAVGLGLMGDPLNLRVRRINSVCVEVDVPVLAPEGRMRLTAHVGCDQDMAFAVARLE